MLADGAAYTREEWNAGDAADYERSESGEWTFQGNVFSSAVFKVE